MNMVNATIIEVSLDGSHQFTSIQSAVDVAADGDTIHVYPGRYYEHIDIIEKSITIQSQYAVTYNQDDVLNTIIDADFQSNCFFIEESVDTVIDGFTCINGVGFNYGSGKTYGGGILVNEESSVDLQNCIIRDNYGDTGGGILNSNDSVLSLSGNIIRNNRAIYQGGGVGVYGATVFFDATNPNSIYNNYGDVQDIFLYNVTCNDIVLDTLSVCITEPDGFFVSYYAPPLNTNPVPAIITQNSYFNQIDADLYVSSDGDDTNNGLTPDTALRTIAYANRIVCPDSLNPNTVYLLSGTYSEELNDQFFPIALQSHTKMLGAGGEPEEVIIGNENEEVKIAISNAMNTEIGNLMITQADESVETVLLISRSSEIHVHDIVCTDNNAEICGPLVMFSENSIFENISVTNIANNNLRLRCIYSYESSEITFNGVIINEIVNNDEDNITPYANFFSSDVFINNFVLTNSTRSSSGLLFQFTNPDYSDTPGNLELNNLLVYNNTSLGSLMPMVNFSTHHDECFINNMTIAYNTGPTAITRFGGDYTVRNSIIYNPDGAYDLGIWVPANGDPYPLWSNVDIDYCLVRNGLNGVAGATNPNNNVLWGSHNIDADPLFRGDINGEIPVGDPRYVQLTQNSPCVDAGTPDTLGMNLPATDITGNPRIWNDIIDMGAHEYNPTVDNSENTSPEIPDEIIVSHFPNPVFLNGNNSGNVFIEFTLPKKPKKQPTLEIYNIKGQKVRSIKITQSFSQLVRSAGLSSEDKQSGEHYSQVWDCRDDNRKPLASGIYFYKVSSEGKEALGKMMLLK
jgi:hypothetical protein